MDISDKIIRTRPPKQHKIYQNIYTHRFSKEDFDKFREIEDENNVETINYNKWKNGINPNSGRKIKIGGKPYNDLSYKFSIFREYARFKKINKTEEEYIRETENLVKIQNAEKIEIDKKNSIIDEYNAHIDNIINEINNLKNWNDYLIYDGIKYGNPCKIRDGIHIENNCGGDIKYIEYESECAKCDNGWGCGSSPDRKGGSLRTFCTIIRTRSLCTKCNETVYMR